MALSRQLSGALLLAGSVGAALAASWTTTTSAILAPAARRVAKNATAVLTSEAATRATTLLLYILVARYLGVVAFGQWALALTLLYAGQVFATAGLKTLITRDIAQDRGRTPRLITHGSVVVALTSGLAVAGLWAFAALMRYPEETILLIQLVSLSLVPASLSAVCEGVFQGWQRMHYIAAANAAGSLLRVAAAFLLLSNGGGLHQLALVLPATQVVTLIVEWAIMLRRVAKPTLRIEKGLVREVGRATIAFLGIDAISAVKASVPLILLSVMVGDASAGLYSAAGQLLVPVSLVCHNVVYSVFPMMCATTGSGAETMRRMAERLVEALLTLALPTAIVLFFLADAALGLLYGPSDFLAAAHPLRIMVWSLILMAFTSVLGHVLIACAREQVTLRIVIATTASTLVGDLLLIGHFGLVGAAIETLLTGTIGLLLHLVAIGRLLAGFDLPRVVWKAVVAGAVVAAYLAFRPDQPLIVVAVTALGLYAIVWSAMAVSAHRGGALARADR